MTAVEIPGYDIKRMLGKGGMATVYLAVHEKFGRDVALKVMASALSADAGFRERFLREASIVARISHPNIVTVYDVGEASGTYYIAMEYHPGGDLKSRLRTGVGVAEALRIAKDVARALDHAHGQGYLHRDIKPDNILFRADGGAVLTDFGVARAIEGDTGLTQLGVVAGTPRYMSPEQARGQALDADADLYSLGVVLFEMLAGYPPYEAPDAIALGILHMNAPLPRLEARLAQFQPLLDRLLAKQPARRPQSGAQLVREIEALEKGHDFALVQATDARESMRVRPPPLLSAASGAADATLPGQVPFVPVPARQSVRWAVMVVLLAGVIPGWWFLHGRPVPASTTMTVMDEAATELAAARTAMARGALVLPVRDNALAHYRRVLVIMPGNGEALAGVQKVAAALQVQAREALAAHRLLDAEQLMATASEVLPQSPGLPGLQQAIVAARGADARETAVNVQRELRRERREEAREAVR